jgi:uncharacterized protein YndB with AHSA1/START domain
MPRTKEGEMTANTPEGQRILGTLRVEDGVGVVRIEDNFDADMDEAWAALTDPQRLARWYGDVDGELKVGGEFHCRVLASGWQGTKRVTVCEPPRRFALVSKGSTEPDESSVEVTLTGGEGKTTIVYEHRGIPVNLLFAYGAGEQIHVEDLGNHLAGQERDSDEGRWAALEPAYRELAAAIR